jgi:O-acetyl-ADP-ribose deacetylase (regulator of RNase III)
VKIVRGDLLEMASTGRFDVIVHGCNCQCRMGRGIAAAIRERFPEAYDADLATAKGDVSKLGTLSQALVTRENMRFTVVNAYTQRHWAGSGVLADYDAIRRVFRAMRSQFHGQRIGYPRIGAGLAGGDWVAIAAIIDEELAGEDHTLVELEMSGSATRKGPP